ncbi:MAG: MBG domain-containing protein, partial [Janthinobacterium lividum]
GGTATFGGASQGAIGAGSYAITTSGLTSANYDITFNTGALVVSKAALAVVANASKTYDGLAFNGGTLSYTGLVNGETGAVLGGMPAFGGASQGAIGAGSYAITTSGLTSANYDITFNTGSLTIAKAALAVAANASKTYDGLAFNGGTLSYTGLVNGETSAVLGGTATFSGASQGAIGAGNYAITTSGLTSANYDITFNTGALVVSKAALAVVANASKTYDGLAFSGGTFGYTGFVNGDTSAVLGGTATFSGASQGAIGAGSYALTPGGLTSANYDITFNTGALVVSKAALAVVANASKMYDGLAFNGGTLSYTGLVNGETGAVLGGMPAFGGASQGAINAGSYAISTTGLTSNNYDISYQTGTLSVSKAPLAVVAHASKTYDGLAFTGGTLSYTGWVNGETNAVLGGAAVFEGASQGAVNPGTYAIITSGLTSNNYDISYRTGALNIAKASLSVTNSAVVPDSSAPLDVGNLMNWNKQNFSEVNKFESQGSTIAAANSRLTTAPAEVRVKIRCGQPLVEGKITVPECRIAER